MQSAGGAARSSPMNLVYAAPRSIRIGGPLLGTALKGRRIPAQGETLGDREVHAGVLKERRIGSGEVHVLQGTSDLPDETADCAGVGY